MIRKSSLAVSALSKATEEKILERYCRDLKDIERNLARTMADLGIEKDSVSLGYERTNS